MFKCQNIQLRKLTWSAGTVGPSGRASVHHSPSCLLTPKCEGLRAKLAKPSGPCSSLGRQCLPPGWLLLSWAGSPPQGEERLWELRTSENKKKCTTVYLAMELVPYLPTVPNALEVPRTSHGFTPVYVCSWASSANTRPFFSFFFLLPQLLLVLLDLHWLSHPPPHLQLGEETFLCSFYI